MKIKNRGRPGSRSELQLWRIVARRSHKLGWENFFYIGTEQKILTRFKAENPEYTEIKVRKEVRVALLQQKYLYLDFRDDTRFWVISAHYNKRAKPCEYIVQARTKYMAKKGFMECYSWLSIRSIRRTNFWCDGRRIFCDFG